MIAMLMNVLSRALLPGACARQVSGRPPAARRLAALLLLALLPVAAQADRAFALRYGSNVNGDLTHIGNMLLHCSDTSGTRGSYCTAARTGSSTAATNRYLTMKPVDADGDASTTMSSGATLNLPAGSTVLFAGLYWHGQSSDTGREVAKFKTPSTGYTNVTGAVDFNSSGNSQPYQAFADVTDLVRAAGNGQYWVADIKASYCNSAGTGTTDSCSTGTNGSQSRTVPVSGFEAGWTLVVAYTNPAQPFRNLSVFDGFQYIQSGNLTVPVSGFVTPFNGPVVTRLGVVTYDGDIDGINDRLQVNSTYLADALRTDTNVFQGLITELGVRQAGRFPSYNNALGYDLARFNVPGGTVPNGATGANLTVVAPTGNTNPDYLWPGLLTFATEVYVPVVTPNVVKTAEDLTPSTPLLRGDTLRWKVTISNTGYDSATNLKAIDNIPAYLTYVPGSMRITAGPNSTPPAKTDASFDDQADFLLGPDRVVFRLGTGANGTQGGTLAYGQSTSFYFDTIVNNDTPSGTLISNAVQIQYNSQTLPTETFAASSAAATATVMGPPVMAKSFAPAVIDPGQAAVLKITVSNPPNNPQPLSGVTFSDTYPAGMVNTATPNPQVTCTPGSTAVPLTGGASNGNSIGMGGATIAPNGSCLITVNVTSSTVGSYLNTTSAVASSDGGSGSPAAATLYVGLPRISKAFAPTTINAGGTSTITFTLQSPAGLPLSQLAFSDALSNMQVAAVPNVVGNCGGGTVTAAPGGNSIALAGGSLPAGGSCTLQVNVTSNAGGAWPNTTTGVSSLEAGSAGQPSNTAVLTVIGPPTIRKSFFPVSVRPASPSTLTVVVSNPNTGVTLTGVGFTDTYPAGIPSGSLVNSSPSNAQATCTPGSSVGTLTAGSGSLAMSGGTLAAGGSCTLTVDVQSSAQATFNNVTGTVSGSTGTGTLTGGTANATLIVANRFNTVTKVFSPTSIAYNDPVTPAYTASQMTITIEATSGSTVTGVNVEDVFPAGLIVANTPAPSLTGCSGAVLEGRTGSGAWGAVASGNTAIRVTGASIAGGGSCAVKVNVTSNSAGAYANSTGTIYSDNGGTAAPVSATLNVLGPVQVSKRFAAASIAPGGNTTLTLAVTNPSPLAVNNVVVEDFFPTTPGNMTTVASGLARTCSNPASAPANTTFVARNSANTGWETSMNTAVADRRGVRIQLPSLAAGQTCKFSINVKASAAGIYDNITGNVSSDNAGTGSTAQATLRVAVPTVTKSFICTQPIIANTGSCTLQIDIAAPPTSALSNARVIDIFPLENASGGGFKLTNASLSSSKVSGTGNCPAFSYRGRTGSGSYPDLTLPIGSLAAPAVGNTAIVAAANADIPDGVTCRISATVTSALNATNIIPVGGLTGTVGGNAASNAVAAQAILQVYDTPTVQKSFAAPSMVVNGNTEMTIEISHLNSAAASGVAFEDLFPASLPAGGQMRLATPLAVSNDCNGTLQSRNSATGVWRALTEGDTGLKLSLGSIPAISTCLITATVTTTQAGDYTNTINTVSTTNFGSSDPASANIKVLAPPTLAKAFTPNAIMVNETSLLTLTLTNPNAAAITGAALTDTYPAGLVNADTPAVSTSCTGATVTASAGGNNLVVTGATIPANSSCTINVQVTSATPGSYTNSLGVGALTTTNAGISAAAAAATLTVAAYMPALNLIKSVSVVSDPVNITSDPKAIPGSVSNYTIRLTNAGQGTVDNDTVFISDELPAQVELFVGVGSNPGDLLQGFSFTNSSAPASGLSCTFGARNNGGDCIDFSAAANDFSYTPNPGADGYDPAIRAIRFRPGGVLGAGGGSGGNPWAEFQFRVRLK